MTAGARDLRQVLAPPDMARAIAELGLEPTRCLVCSGGSFERLFRRSGKWFWRCADCELVFVHDIYPEFTEDTERLDRPSPGEVVATGYDVETLHVAGPSRRRRIEAFLLSLERHRRLNRLLELGCGQGLFLEHAAQAGWQVQGVEILPPLVELARRRGLPVFAGELEQAGFPGGWFDVVTASEVIEHVIDPVPLLAEAARILRPGGAAVLTTGNARSWAARLRGGSWPYYRFGGHLHIRFYSPRAARSLSRASGFDSAECRTRGFAFREAEELRGRWFEPFVKLAQAPISVLATAAGAGHRLVMRFCKADTAP